MTNLELIDHLLELSKTLVRDLQAIPGVSASITIVNTSGMEPTAVIVLKGPAYHDHQIEVQMTLDALEENEHHIYLVLEAIDVQTGNWLLNTRCGLANVNELKGYIDKALSLYHNLMSPESENV